jgi:hypothetical protein
MRRAMLRKLTIVLTATAVIGVAATPPDASAGWRDDGWPGGGWHGAGWRGGWAPYYGGHWGYGPYAYDTRDRYSRDCYTGRQWVPDGYGRWVLMRVPVCPY